MRTGHDLFVFLRASTLATYHFQITKNKLTLNKFHSSNDIIKVIALDERNSNVLQDFNISQISIYSYD